MTLISYKNKETFILLSFAEFGIISVFSEKGLLTIKKDDFHSYLQSLCNDHKQRYNLIVCDLTLFVDLFKNATFTENFIIKPFRYRNVYYCVELRYLLNPKSKLLLRDYYNFLSTDKPASLEELYNNFKCILCSLKDNFNLNIFNKRIFSIASISFNIFKMCYPLQYKQIGNLNGKQDYYIRKAFFGGRSEIFKPVSDKTSYYYDINSLYPFIMKTMPLPIGKPKYHDCTYFDNNFDLESFYGFVDVQVTSGTSSIGLLPIKSLSNHPEIGIVYPLGTFRGIYFSKELQLAVANGFTIKKIFSGYSFNSAIIFDNFIKKTYMLRLDSQDPLLKLFYKKLMNSLYGRFSCIYDVYEVNRDSIEEYALNYDTNDDFTIVKKVYNHIALASAITSFARVYMFTLLQSCFDNLLYWDTDGIFLDKEFFTSSKELGKFRLISINESAYFIATKFYFYKTITFDYIYTFRGITTYNYLLNPLIIKKLFIEALINNLKNNQFRITFIFIMKDTTLPEVFTFLFYKKRRYFYKDYFLTKPYTIANAIQKNT